MSPVIVVGGGISGVACARVLVEAGLPVLVLDRGRHLGGRMATRTVDGRPVDTGASYLTVSDPEFSAVVEDWRARGLARVWTDTFSVLGDDQPATSTGPTRWGAAHGLRSLVEDLARGLPVEYVEVRSVTVGPALRVDGRPARAVVLAMPDPQARRLLPAGSPARAAVDRDYEPVLALAARWPRRGWAEDFDGAFVSGDHALGWIADDGRRRGDAAPVLVAHSTSGLARAHLDQPDQAREPMAAALSRLLGLPPPESAFVHRWTFAKPADPREADYYLGEDLVGVCGDGWTAKPRVEGAWRSGRALGEAVRDRLA